MDNNKVSFFNEKPTGNEKQISTDPLTLINKNQESDRRQIYTDKEAAVYLRISQITLWRLRKAGKISFHRAASKLIYTQADLDNYLQSTKRDAFGVRGMSNEK